HSIVSEALLPVPPLSQNGQIDGTFGSREVYHPVCGTTSYPRMQPFRSHLRLTSIGSSGPKGAPHCDVFYLSACVSSGWGHSFRRPLRSRWIFACPRPTRCS